MLDIFGAEGLQKELRQTTVRSHSLFRSISVADFIFFLTQQTFGSQAVDCSGLYYYCLALILFFLCFNIFIIFLSSCRMPTQERARAHWRILSWLPIKRSWLSSVLGWSPDLFFHLSPLGTVSDSPAPFYSLLPTHYFSFFFPFLHAQLVYYLLLTHIAHIISAPASHPTHPRIASHFNTLWLHTLSFWCSLSCFIK